MKVQNEGGSSFAQPSIPRFDGDYEHWSLLMENLLRSKEHWCVIEAEIPSDDESINKKELEELRLKDLKAKNYLFAAIDKSTLKTITKRDTAKQLWDAMQIKF